MGEQLQAVVAEATVRVIGVIKVGSYHVPVDTVWADSKFL